MAKMVLDEYGFLEEPCLSCDKARTDNLFYEWYCDEKECPYKAKKQIARKPYCIEDKMWCCPVCDNHLLPKWVKYPTELMPKTEGLPHCMSCGQKIDFGE